MLRGGDCDFPGEVHVICSAGLLERGATLIRSRVGLLSYVGICHSLARGNSPCPWALAELGVEKQCSVGGEDRL